MFASAQNALPKLVIKESSSSKPEQAVWRNGSALLSGSFSAGKGSGFESQDGRLNLLLVLSLDFCSWYIANRELFVLSFEAENKLNQGCCSYACFAGLALAPFRELYHPPYILHPIFSQNIIQQPSHLLIIRIHKMYMSIPFQPSIFIRHQCRCVPLHIY